MFIKSKKVEDEVDLGQLRAYVIQARDAVSSAFDEVDVMHIQKETKKRNTRRHGKCKLDKCRCELERADGII